MVPNHAPAFVYSGKTEADNPTLKFIWNLLNILTIRKIKFEIMGRTRLISIRIEEETLERISQIAPLAQNQNRSAIINNILRNVVECSDQQSLQILTNWWDAFSAGFKVNVSKIK